MGKRKEKPQAVPLDVQDPEGKGRTVRVRVDDRDMTTCYANGFRTNLTAEEVAVDFGMNLTAPTAQEGGGQDQIEIVFKLQNRVIMNFYSAKRLALSLGQLVRRYEDRFGMLELDVTKRVKREG